MDNSNSSSYIKVSSATTINHKCMIPTFRMLYGRPFTFFPQEWYCYYSNGQLPLALFEGYNHVLQGVDSFWLQECLNGSDSFIAMTQNGPNIMGNCKASQSKGVRVVFIIGG